MAEPAAFLTEIERFALHDGPGIRTTVFFKGCPLRCYWCANPETQSPGRELLYDERRCVRCGACEKACPHGAVAWREGPVFLRGRCAVCGACAESCPAGAITYAGEAWAIPALVRLLLRDRDYYERSGGGVTLSGGEPFFQPEAALTLVRALTKEGVHTAVETAGTADPALYREAAADTRLFLFDLKHADAAVLRAGTGAELSDVLASLAALKDAGARVVGRVPVIPGFNADEQSMAAIFALAAKYGITEVHLLPCHALGSGKYKKLGRRPPGGTLSPEALAPFAQMGAAMGLAVRTGG